MRLRQLLLLSIYIAIAAAEEQQQQQCVCGPQRIPCPCPTIMQSKLNNLRDRVFRAFSVQSPSTPAPPSPTIAYQQQQQPYFVLSRNIAPPPFDGSSSSSGQFSGASNSIIEQPVQQVQQVQQLPQPIGYVLTDSLAEAFYLDPVTGQLMPGARPRGAVPVPQTTVPVPALVPAPQQPPQLQLQQQLQQQAQFLTTAARPSFLVSGAAQTPRRVRVVRRPAPQPHIYTNPGTPSLGAPPPGIRLPVYLPPQPVQPHLQQLQPTRVQPRFIHPRRVQHPQRDFSQKSRSSSIRGWSEPNLVRLSSLSNATKWQPRRKRVFNLEKPKPGDVEDFSFVDAGGESIEQEEIERKFKLFTAGASPSASLGEAAPLERSRPRSLLETLPSGLIAKVAKRIALKLPPPKFSFSIKPSKMQSPLHPEEFH